MTSLRPQSIASLRPLRLCGSMSLFLMKIIPFMLYKSHKNQR